MNTLYPLPPTRTWSHAYDEIANHIIDTLGEATPQSRAALHLLFRIPGEPWATDWFAQSAHAGWREFCERLYIVKGPSAESIRMAQFVNAAAIDAGLPRFGSTVRELSAESREALKEAIDILGDSSV
jgi:hypothetical protein